MHRRSLRLVALLAVPAALLAGCAGSTSGSPAATGGSATSAASSTSGHGSTTAVPKVTPLRSGERYLDLSMPASYTPSAPTTTGHDDYRCFLLDPKLAKETLVTGIDIVPGNPKVVHHVILFKVNPDQVARAKAADAAGAGPGWTCFGDAGIGRGAAGNNIDNAPWIGAWAPGGGEKVLPDGVGIPLVPGSMIAMQVHYNLLVDTAPDLSRARLRVADPSATTKPLQTMLMPAPVELPCRPGKSGSSPLCFRDKAVADVKARFNEKASLADLLHLLCPGGMPGPTQTCDRKVKEAGTIRAVAGHMHLLGKEVSVTLNPDTPDAKTLLDIPEWNFDDQATRPLPTPVDVKPGDVLRVSCTHSQQARDLLPAFKGQPERYVVWGEGTTDEMCLGIVLWTPKAS